MADCFKTLKKFDQAVSSYSKAIQLLQKPIQSVEYKLNRAVCFYKLGKDHESMLDFQSVLQSDPENIKAHFYLARLLAKGIGNKNSKPEDTLLHLELVANSENEQMSGNALVLIAKLNLRQKAFGEADNALTRAFDNHFQSKRFTLLKDFTEGVINLEK